MAVAEEIARPSARCGIRSRGASTSGTRRRSRPSCGSADLNPVADNEGKDFQSFHVKDPDGFDVQITNGNRKNRRQGAANGQLSVAAPFEPTFFKTVWLDHISFAVTNYKESAAFYVALLGWKPGRDEGSQNECEIGDLGNIIIRGGGGWTRRCRGRHDWWTWRSSTRAPSGDQSHLVRAWRIGIRIR